MVRGGFYWLIGCAKQIFFDNLGLDCYKADMKKFTYIFHLIHFIYLVLSVVLVLNKDQLNKFFGLNTSDYLLYWVILGIGLYAILWFKDVFETFNLKRKLKNMEAEKNKYKAELYDKTDHEVHFDQPPSDISPDNSPKKDASDTA